MYKKLFFIFWLLIILTALFFLYHLLEKIWEGSEGPHIKLYLSGEDKVVSLKLEEYVKGAVAAEMPASFELEALKAQAICARTYAVKKILQGRSYKRGADLSDNVNECQAYITEEDFKKTHPYAYKKLYRKIEQAVQETRGIIIIYHGEPIDALYHSTCGGQTENADEIWGHKVPYLVARPCSFCQHSPRYETVTEFSHAKLQEALKIPEAINKIVIIEKTSHNRARKIRINNRIIIEADYFREKLGLPSTWWSFENKKDKLIIKSRGYGHGAGMCQYGADGMAKKGYTYEEILKYYYTGVKFCKLDY